MDHPVCNVMELDLALAITLTQEHYALLVNVVKEKLWCPAFLTAFVKVSNTSNECFQNSPFFSSHCYWVYHTTIAFWQKLKKKNIVLQKDNKYCHTESISKYISNNFWSDCNCHPDGSTSQQCDEHGICNCVEGATGDKCNGTSIGFVPILPPIRM